MSISLKQHNAFSEMVPSVTEIVEVGRSDFDGSKNITQPSYLSVSEHGAQHSVRSASSARGGVECCLSRVLCECTSVATASVSCPTAASAVRGVCPATRRAPRAWGVHAHTPPQHSHTPHTPHGQVDVLGRVRRERKKRKSAFLWWFLFIEGLVLS